jgi:single-strand DNA-binding protein
MLNHIELQGYLGRDPELSERQGQNGYYKSVSFSIGVGRDFGDGTDWFRCIMNGKRAEVIEKYFRKGSEILVSGRMESYKPRNNPDSTAWIVKVEDFHFTRNGTGSGSGSSSGSSSGYSAAPTQERQQTEPQQMGFNDLPDSFEEQEEDIPF